MGKYCSFLITSSGCKQYILNVNSNFVYVKTPQGTCNKVAMPHCNNTSESPVLKMSPK